MLIRTCLQGLPTLAGDERFQLPSLDIYVSRFFEWDTSHYALIHRSTFE
jgi:hypothetical protein